MDLNSFTITCRLTKDAVVKAFPSSGKKHLDFSVANNTGYGEHAKVQYFNCMMLGDDRVTKLEKYLIKGKQVAIEGTLESNDFTSKDGVEVKSYRLLVNSLVLLGNKSDGEVKKEPEYQYEFLDQDDLDARLKKSAQARTNAHSSGVVF